MATTVPTVNPITATPPERSQGQDEFNSNAADYLVQQKTFSTEVNAMITPLNTAVGEAETAATNAETSATNAQTAADASAGTANYQGEWSVATGPASVGESYSDLGLIWVVKQAIADITLSQPAEGADWQLVSARPAGVFQLTAGEDLNAGRSVYVDNDGKAYKVRDNDPVLWKLAGFFKAADSYRTTNAQWVVSATNNAGTFLFAYVDETTADNYVVAATIDDYDRLTFGTPVVFETSGVISPNIVYHSTNDAFVVIYADDGDNDYLQYCVVTVSGTTATVNPSGQVGTNIGVTKNGEQTIAAVYNSVENAIVVVADQAGASFTIAIAGTLSGSSVTWGSSIDSGKNSQKVTIAVSDTGEMSAGLLEDTSFDTEVWPLNVSGTSMTASAPTTITSGSTYGIAHCYHSISNTFVTFVFSADSIRVDARSLSTLTYTSQVGFRQISDTLYNPETNFDMYAYADPDSEAIILICGGKGGSEGFYTETRVNLTADYFLSVGKTNRLLSFFNEANQTIGRGCTFSDGSGKLAIPMKTGEVFYKNFNHADYNYGWTNFQSVPHTTTTAKQLKIAVKPDGTQILVVRDGNFLVGNIDVDTKVVTWGTVQNIVGTSGDFCDLAYDEKQDMYAMVYYSAATPLAIALSVSGTTVTAGTPVTLGTAVTQNTTYIGVGYNRANGIFSAGYEEATTEDLNIVNFTVGADRSITTFGEVNFNKTITGPILFWFDPVRNSLLTAYRETTGSGKAVTYTDIGGVNAEFSSTVSDIAYSNPVFQEDYTYTSDGSDVYLYDSDPYGLYFFKLVDTSNQAADDHLSPRCVFYDALDDSYYHFGELTDTGIVGTKFKLDYGSDRVSTKIDSGLVGLPKCTEYYVDYDTQSALGPVAVFHDIGENIFGIAFFQGGGRNNDKFIGLTNESKTANNLINITSKGFVNSQNTGLVVGEQFIERDGYISKVQTATSRKVGTAISSTSLYLDA